MGDIEWISSRLPSQVRFQGVKSHACKLLTLWISIVDKAWVRHLRRDLPDSFKLSNPKLLTDLGFVYALSTGVV